jgi:acyl-CoA reductase-like NAD-dependent aldehyde dehydrogenase
VAERLRAGVVWANTFNEFDQSSPFGGYKESGFGREGGRHLLWLASRLAPAIVSGNTPVVIASERSRLPAVSFAEVLATSDAPPGLVDY